ncbi:hypothetical protein D9615_009914 [Tricholomella constricta]|uniref:Uncharacterized protein n=1 Tax=Tricholomella constricta TaxID=117010 RepID=A0A8H5LYA1_9AGAR|nr:hypothetical protein D9615_009914 [Tricholomella constricta]
MPATPHSRLPIKSLEPSILVTTTVRDYILLKLFKLVRLPLGHVDIVKLYFECVGSGATTTRAMSRRFGDRKFNTKCLPAAAADSGAQPRHSPLISHSITRPLVQSEDSTSSKDGRSKESATILKFLLKTRLATPFMHPSPPQATQSTQAVDPCSRASKTSSSSLRSSPPKGIPELLPSHLPRLPRLCNALPVPAAHSITAHLQQDLNDVPLRPYAPYVKLIHRVETQHPIPPILCAAGGSRPLVPGKQETPLRHQLYARGKRRQGPRRAVSVLGCDADAAPAAPSGRYERAEYEDYAPAGVERIVDMVHDPTSQARSFISSMTTHTTSSPSNRPIETLSI